MSYIQGDATITFLFRVVKFREEHNLEAITEYTSNNFNAAMSNLLDFVEESMH